MNRKTAGLLFALALGGVVVFALAASASALPCLQCFDVGGEQTAVANHAEPNCAWAQMHACTKARWQIEANCGPNWREQRDPVALHLFGRAQPRLLHHHLRVSGVL